MKRALSIILLCLFMSGCSVSFSQEAPEEYSPKGVDKMFSAQIVELNKKSMLVKVLDGFKYDKVIVNMKDNPNSATANNIFQVQNQTEYYYPGKLKVGSYILVYYDGGIMKTNPPQISSSLIWDFKDVASFEISKEDASND